MHEREKCVWDYLDINWNMQRCGRPDMICFICGRRFTNPLFGVGWDRDKLIRNPPMYSYLLNIDTYGYPWPFWSNLAGFKSVSVRPSVRPGCDDKYAVEAIASSSGKFECNSLTDNTADNSQQAGKPGRADLGRGTSRFHITEEHEYHWINIQLKAGGGKHFEIKKEFLHNFIDLREHIWSYLASTAVQ